MEVDLLGACDAIAAPGFEWPVLIRRNDGQAGAKVVMHSMQRATRIQGSSVRDKRVESRSTLSVRAPVEGDFRHAAIDCPRDRLKLGNDRPVALVEFGQRRMILEQGKAPL